MITIATCVYLLIGELLWLTSWHELNIESGNIRRVFLWLLIWPYFLLQRKW